MVAIVLYLVFGRTGPAPTAAATRSSFVSAMRKAGVKAAVPAAPTPLTTVRSTGSHPFSATFTADEVAALLNTFPCTASVAGVQIAMQGASISISAPGSVKFSAKVAVNGGTYIGAATLPVSFSGGQIASTGATALSVEGLPGSDAQRTQVTDALTTYFNAYLSAAPGLHIDSARVLADGVSVKGTAPDSLSYP